YPRDVKPLHWAFVAPSRPLVPERVNRKSTFASSIDAFILARLAKARLKPSPEADRVTLIRRVSLDLTGLPPSIAEVDAFVNDHKFDPFSQRDYYQFYGFFNNTIEDGHGKDAPEGVLEIPGENEATENVRKELEEAEVNLDRYLSTKVSEVMKWEEALTPLDE